MRRPDGLSLSRDLAGQLTLPCAGVLVAVFGDLPLRAGAILNNTGMLKYGGTFADEGATINGNAPMPR